MGEAEDGRRLLAQDVADSAWSAQVGRALSQGDVAVLLARSEQTVSEDVRLLCVHNRDGRPVYPVMQFDGRAPLRGVAEVVATLGGVMQPLTVASWLTSASVPLGGRRPVDVLRDGDAAAVIAAAARLAATR